MLSAGFVLISYNFYMAAGIVSRLKARGCFIRRQTKAEKSCRSDPKGLEQPLALLYNHNVPNNI